MNCADRDEWLGPLLYRDLPFDRETAAREHLDSCAACRAEAEGLAAFVAKLPPPAEMPRRRFPWRWAWAAALLVAFVAGRLTMTQEAPVKTLPPLARSPGPAAAKAPPSTGMFSPAMVAFLENGAEGLRPRD